MQRPTTLLVLALAIFAPALAAAADPTVAQAMRLQPVQKDVDCDRPAADEYEKCSIEGHKSGGGSGWYVYTDTRQLLRRFLDSNRDGKVDRWCYYKNGIEVYRDIDENFNSKADQYRWLGTAGIRWGLDENEDGAIDRWKVISPEEVTSEVVAAIRDADTGRFQRLLISDQELAQLGLSSKRAAELEERMKQAVRNFASLSKAQRNVSDDARWIHFGGSQPGVIPAGTDNAKSDIYVYDNVSAVIESGGEHSQVAVGTLVQAGHCWRLIDLPAALDSKQVARGGFFFNEMYSQQLADVQAEAGAVPPRMQELVDKLGDVDTQIESTRDTRQLATLNDDRAQILLDIVKLAPNEQDRGIWIRQFADTVGAAVQSGAFPAGVQRLRELTEKVLRGSDDQHYVAHVEYVMLSADYGRQMQDPDADHAKVHEKWLKDLEKFVEDHPQTEDAPDALLQLAFAEEFAGEVENAVKYYSKIVTNFRDSPVAPKAAGAKRRLESVGKTLDLEGRTADGKILKLSDLRGKAVLVHYWATWCDTCVKDLEILRDMQAKYGRKGFTLVGISCDNGDRELKEFLRTHRIPWPQMYEPGGLDSRLAVELGVIPLPTMLLLDKTGKVVNNGIHATELDDALSEMFR